MIATRSKKNIIEMPENRTAGVYAIINKTAHKCYIGNAQDMRICPICGKEFEKHSTRVTCSPECEKEYRRIKQNKADIRRGKRKTPADQKYNSGLPRSGVVGVTYHRQSGKWQATYKGKYIGLCDTIEQAAEAIEKYKFTPRGQQTG